MNKPFAVALIAAGTLLLAGCPAGVGGKDYSRSQARTVSDPIGSLFFGCSRASMA